MNPARFSLDKVTQRPRAKGKFLYVGDEKFYVKGATYGAFAPNSQGHQFPESPDVAADFRLMQAAGINAILTYTVPPISLLDQAAEHGIRVIITTPWMEYVCFLEDAAFRKQVRDEVRAAVASCQRHPAVLMYCVAKELPPAIVRWHGQRKVESFLDDLCKVAKDQDPESLVTYTNFPTTEYLELPFVDVFTFNVYLHERSQMCSYLSRLQHLSGELPIVLTEFGQCSFRHGREGQARFLDWQIEEAFDHGLSGAVVFGWTDPFYQDNMLIEEWGFGLVDAQRKPKPSYYAVQRRFTEGVPFPPEREWPRISVVVAAYNAGRTLEPCLRSLEQLRYPDYEVIVVNDGSKDNTGEIMAKFTSFRGITTRNQGVSAARNEGLRAATGKIVAYIDSDAEADPDWLTYTANTYLKFDVVGVGGPNLVPAEDNWVAKCVYRAPGGPTQVMLDDESAEHIPGCNMTFLKSALDEIGEFDPQFTAAADDVDICWRLLDRGWKIGFSPSAVVWHHRRPSVKAYWKQQVGYGVSEAKLEKKYPSKFNPWGHTFWGGRIYGPYPFFRLLSRPVVYSGLWGSAPFQPMYGETGGGVLAFLPRAMEWHVILAGLMALGFFFPWAWVAVGIGLSYTILFCVYCAAHAKLDVLIESDGPPTWGKKLKWRTVIAWLNFLEPLARDWGRLKGGLTPWRSPNTDAEGHRSSNWWSRVYPFRRTAKWAIPGGMGLEKFAFLSQLTNRLTEAGCAVGWNPSVEDWDLKTRRGAMAEAYVRMVVEHHGGAKRQARVSAIIQPPRSTSRMFLGLIALAGVFGLLGLPAPGVFLLVVVATLWVTLVIQAGRLETGVSATCAEVARQLDAANSSERRSDESA